MTALILGSHAAHAGCTITARVIASGPPPCTVSGSFATTADHDSALLAGSGGGISMTGGSASTTGLSSGVAGVRAGGTVSLNGTTISASGDGSVGLFINGAGGVFNATNVTVTTLGGVDASTGAHADGAYNGSFSPYSGGGTMTLANSSITTSGAYAYGVSTHDSGTTTITGGSITTNGASSDAVLAQTNAQVSVQGTTIQTNGDGAKGFDIQSGAVGTISGVNVTTIGTIDPVSGFHAQGLYNGNGNSSGLGSTGAGVANVTNSTFVTHGDDSNGVDTLNGGTTTLSGGSVQTSGLSAAGVVSDSSALVTLTGVSVTTTGNGSTGLAVNGGAEADAANSTIATQGGVDATTGFHADGAYNGPSGSFTTGGVMKLTDTTVSTQAANTTGVLTSTGGATTILGGSITTSGSPANAVEAENGGTVTVGPSAVGPTIISTSGTNSLGAYARSGGSVALTGSQIATAGVFSPGLGAYGAGSSVTASTVAVSTTGPTLSVGAGAAYGGSLTLNGGSFHTTGQGSYGLGLGGGSLTINGGSVQVDGISSAGVYVIGGPFPITLPGFPAGTSDVGASKVTMNGTTVTTTGPRSPGIILTGSGATLNAIGIGVTTQGAPGPASPAYGLYNGPSASVANSASGGAANISNSSFTTSGAQADAAFTSTGGVTTISGGTFATSGIEASGIVTAAGGVTNLDGASVTTAGLNAHALYATEAGSQASSQANLSGTNSFTTSGDGAIGVYAALGAVVSANGASTTNVTTTGGVGPAIGASPATGAYGVNADGAGAKVTLGAATITTSGPGAYALLSSDAAASGSAGAITVTGTLNVKTTNAAATAVGLQGNGASLAATGGGTIVTAGNAISFSGGTNQIATFDNFTINSPSGDLVFADPSSSTVNFNNTTANAGANNLIDATAGSAVTLNANASNLTGVIRTDSKSTSNVNLTNATTWTITGPSTVSNLSVANSIVVFAPPGSGSGFKTVTVTNYSGSGANITMNAALGGSNSSADQIIINGGHATGTTLLTIKNVGGLGGSTTGSGIPLVIATNGGTIASNAFALANTPIVGGFKYTLNESGDEWFLVSQPASTVADITNSLTNVAKAQQKQMITNRVLGSILLGATEQVSCSSCGSGFASIGSFAAGAHGRWSLSDELTLMGGFSYNQWNASGITVENAPTIAGSLVYDFWKWGASRPFLEAGGVLTPYEDVHYSRTYANGFSPAIGNASAIDRDLSLFARAGWVARLSPIDEAAIYGDLSRNWMQTGGYAEATSALNPYPATVSSGLDLLNVARVGAQYTHLFNGNIEANVSGAVAYGFGSGAGSAVNVYNFGPIAPNALPNTTWVEYGARIGYRYSDRLVIDAFVVGTAFGQVGTTLHGGVGLRYSF